MDSTTPQYSDDSIDFADLLRRVRRGLPLILGLAFTGLALGIVISLVAANKQPAVSTLRVTFGFPGFERGTYPNETKFQPDDIRAPDVVNEAIKRLGLKSTESDFSSRIRGAIGISGLVSPNIIKERDRLRAAGQTLPAYIPDEYEISLSLPRDYLLDIRQRELLLAEIVNAYLEKFRRTYVLLPPQFGNAFNSLKEADYPEYELTLTKEANSLIDLLRQQIVQSKQFRSPTTNLSFQDLLKETELFTQLRLDAVLGQIYTEGLSKDRSAALVKMDYKLRLLRDQEQLLKEQATVVAELLAKTQDRAQNYVLATKAQAPQGTQPMLDQGFVDTLLANDAYNFLVRKALDAGLAVKRVQADIAQLQDRRQLLETFTKGQAKDQSDAIANTRASLATVEANYQNLLGEVRTTLEDYSRQEYADAVRISMQARTGSLIVSLLIGTVIGASTGFALGLGLSLLKAEGLGAKG